MILLLIATITALHLLTPYWWWIIPLPFLYGVWRPTSGFRAFLAGGLSCSLVWLAPTLYYARFADELLPRIVELSQASSPQLLFVGAVLIALICGGTACAAGFYLRDAFTEQVVEDAAEPPAKMPSKT